MRYVHCPPRIAFTWVTATLFLSAPSPAQIEFEDSPEPAIVSQLRESLSGAPRDTAVATLAQTLYQLADRMLENAGAGGDLQDEDLAGISELAEELRLVGPVQKMLVPGSKVIGKPVARYGAICELLGDREGAITHYERALEATPADEGLRLRLFIVLLEKDPRAAVGHMAELGDFYLDAAGSVFADYFSDLRVSNKISTLLGDVAAMVNKRDGDLGDSPGWLLSVLDSWTGGRHLDDVYVPPYYQQDLFGKDHSDWRGRSLPNANLETMRRDHDQFCRALLTSPTLCLDTFERLSAKPDEKLRAELPTLAEAALLKAEPAAIMNHTNIWWSFDRGFEVPKFSAAEYLARHASRSGDRTGLDRALAGVRQASLLSQLKDWHGLYLGGEAEFAAAASRRIAAGEAAGVVRCWTDRDSGVDLMPAFLAHTREHISSETIADYVEADALKNGIDVVGRHMQEIGEHFLGKDSAKWPDVISEAIANRQNVMPEIPHYFNTVRRLIHSPTLTFAVVGAFEKQYAGHAKILGFVPGVLAEGHPAHDSQFYRTDIERLKRFFRASPFLGDFASFRLFLPEQGGRDTSSFTVEMLDTISRLPPDARARLRDYFGSLPESFGRNALRDATGERHDGGMNSVLGRFCGQRSAIEALPPDGQARYARFVTALEDASPVAPRFDRAKMDAFKWLQGLELKRLAAESERRLAEAAEGANKQQLRRSMIRDAGVVLQSLVPGDLAKAKALLERVNVKAGVGDAAVAKHRFLGNKDGPTSPANDLLCDFLRTSSTRQVRLEGTMRQRMPDIFKRIKFACNVMAGTREADVPIEWSENYRFAMDLIGRKFASPTRRPPSVVVAGFLDTLAEDVDPEYAPLMVNTMFGIMGWWKKENNAVKYAELSRNISLLLESRTDGRKNGPMAKELLMALKVYQKSVYRSQAEGITDPAKLPPEQAHYLAVLDSEALSSLAKIGIATEVIEKLGTATEPPIALAAARLLGENAEAGTLVSTPQIYIPLKHLLNLPQEGEASELSRDLADSLRPLMLPDGWRDNPEMIDYRKRAAYRYAKLCLRQGDPETVAELAEAYAEYIGVHPVQWLHLTTEEGLHRVALSIVKTHYAKLALSVTKFALPYSRSLDEQISEIRAEAGREDVAYIAELILKSLPDPVGGLEGAARDERLAELASRFPNSLQNRDARESAITLLASSVNASQVAKPLLAELSSARPLSQLMGLEDEASLRLRYIHSGHIAADIADGRTEVFATAVADVSPRATSSKTDAGLALDSICNAAEAAILSRWSYWTDEQSAAVCRAWREALATPNFAVHNRSGIRHVAFAMFIHAMLDEMDAFRTTVAALPPKIRERIESGKPVVDLAVVLAQSKPPDFGGIPEAERTRSKLDIILRTLDNPVGVVPNRDFRGLIDGGWISRDEFIAAREELLERAPTDGLTALKLARFAIDDDDRDEAERLISLTDILPRGPMSLYVLARRAWLHNELGNYDAAYKALAQQDRLLADKSPIALSKTAHSLYRNDLWREISNTAAKQLAADGDPMPMLRMLAGESHALGDGAMYWDLMRDAYGGAATAALENGDRPKAAGYLEAAALADIVLLKKRPSRLQGHWGLPQRRLRKLLEPELGKAATFIPRSAGGWRYFAKGTEPAKGWSSPEFDDSSWKTGTAPFGYGDPGFATKLSETVPGGSDKLLTAYFRRSFDLAATDSVKSLWVDLRRDDGAAVYVNGTRVLYHNLPDSEYTYETKALEAIGDKAETTFYRTRIDPALLKEGKNVIAAEVHQVKATSSDMAFDLGIVANDIREASLVRDIDPATLSEKIGEAWTVLPEGIRKLLAAKKG